MDRAGPFIVNVVRVDLTRPDIELRLVRANDQLKGRERPESMTRRLRAAGSNVVAAVNGDFFDVQTGENENNQVIDGEWWKGLKVTDSPYDTYDNVHSQLALDAARHPSIDRYLFDGNAWIHGSMTPILTLNFNPSGKPEGTALYTARYGAAAPRDTTRQTVEASLFSAGRRGDTLLFVAHDSAVAHSGSPIPRDGAVLAAYGPRTKELQSIAGGDTVRVLLATLPRLPSNALPSVLVGGWPRILRDGANVARQSATAEGTISRNAEVRHPRTAVGISRDRKTLVLATVDGRSAASVGMTLVELAELMRRLGAWDALNFDGGGSTTMVVGDSVVNTPSERTGEREVGGAFVVVRRPRRD